MRPTRRIGMVITFLMSVFCLCFFAGCADEEEAAPAGITGVYAEDVVVVYDGDAHGIVVSGLASGDLVFYSLAEYGDYVAVCPMFVMPGEYRVYYKVVRGGCEPLYSSAKVTVRKSSLGGISCRDKTVIYDGQEHGIDIAGLEPGDEVTYDGASEVGEHEIYYTVDRGYGDYYGRCVLTIVPDIRGEYISPTAGVAVIDSDDGIFWGVTGAGELDEKSFECDGQTLVWDEKSYAKKPDGHTALCVIVNGTAVYFSALPEEEIGIEFGDAGAELKAGARTVATFGGMNYCESAEGCTVTRSFESNNVGLTLGEGASLTLSCRAVKPDERVSVVHIYDGSAHDAGVTGAAYKYNGEYSAEPPEFTETGTYSVEIVVEEDGFLPRRVRASVAIAPDLSGSYYSADGYIEIDGKTAKVNGAAAELVFDDGWTLNGAQATKTDAGLNVGSAQYTRIDEDHTVAMAVVNGSVSLLAVDPIDIIITVSGESLTMTGGDTVYLSVDIPSGTVSITLNGAAITPIGNDYILGSSDLLRSRLAIISVTTE